jgi:hypothetical protein
LGALATAHPPALGRLRSLLCDHFGWL